MNRITCGASLGVAALLLLSCSKPNASGAAPTGAASASSPVAAAPPSAPVVAQPRAPTAAPPVEDVSVTAPENFAGATAVANPSAKGLGCEAKSKQGWLQLVCHKKNGTGGHPKRAVIGTDADAPDIVPDDQGELKLVVPWRSGAFQSGFIEWTDAKYTIETKDAELKLEWASSLDLRRSCAGLEKASRQVAATAQKQEAFDHLTPAEASKFPHFGVCQPAGIGSWALVLRGVSAAGADRERNIKFDLDVAFVDLEGVVTKADFGVIDAVPGALEIRPLQVYDYDDDGSDELIVPYDIKAIVANAAPPSLPVIWTRKSGQLTAFAGAPKATGGGAQTTHLEFDMRPDIGQYGPFLAYLSSDCGLTNCPTRLTGPVLFARSMPDGTFSYGDAAAKGSVERACGKTPSLVVEAGGVNAARTAQNVACARLHGAVSETLVTEIKSKSAVLCKTGDTCPLLDKLLLFANASFDR